MKRQNSKDRTKSRAGCLDLTKFERANRQSVSGFAMRIFVAIGDLWDLTEMQRRLVLGFPSRATYYLWCKRARNRAALTLSLDVLCRISAVLSIQQALEVLRPGDD